MIILGGGVSQQVMLAQKITSVAHYNGIHLQGSYSIAFEPETSLVLVGPCQHKTYFTLSTTELGTRSVLCELLKRHPTSHLMDLIGYRGGW